MSGYFASKLGRPLIGRKSAPVSTGCYKEDDSSSKKDYLQISDEDNED